MCYCDPITKDGHHFVGWIGEYFGTCAYTTTDIAAFSLGLLNIGFWLVAQVPQFVVNYRLKRVDGLSPLFLGQWLLGDITNLLGCIFTHQHPIQLYTAVYFCFMDLVLLLQFAYYAILHKERAGEDRPLLWDEVGGSKKKRLYAVAALSIVGASSLVWTAATPNRPPAGRVLLGSEPCVKGVQLEDWERTFGIVSAWLSGVLYFCSRMPQIYRNYKRKSVKGLAFGMFFCAVCANTLYGLSIILAGITINKQFWESTFPYLLGSICVLSESSIIVSQFAIYKWIPESRAKTKFIN